MPRSCRVIQEIKSLLKKNFKREKKVLPDGMVAVGGELGEQDVDDALL